MNQFIPEKNTWIFVKEKEEDKWEKRLFVEMDLKNELYGCINIWNGKIVYWEKAKKLEGEYNV